METLSVSEEGTLKFTEPSSYGILFHGPEIVEQFWRIGMPCGKDYTYPLNGLPEVDTPCECGDPDHWVVRYEREDQT